jgi:hypothetical protein
MNAEQIRDEIRKLNWIERIGIYRWINEEVAGDHRNESDRSLKIRLEIERSCRFPGQVERRTLNAERQTPNASLTLLEKIHAARLIPGPEVVR